MKLFVDGDSCNKLGQVIRIGKEFHVPVHVYCDWSHEIEKEGMTLHMVDIGKDSADFAILRDVSETDVIITNDIGLALIANGKGVACLNTKGIIFTEQNIGYYMKKRYYLQQRCRKSKRRQKIKQHTESVPFDESLRYLLRKKRKANTKQEKATGQLGKENAS